MSKAKTVKVDLRQDYRLEGVLYRQGRGVEVPLSVAKEAGLYEAPKATRRRKPAAKAKAAAE